MQILEHEYIYIYKYSKYIYKMGNGIEIKNMTVGCFLNRAQSNSFFFGFFKATMMINLWFVDIISRFPTNQFRSKMVPLTALINKILCNMLLYERVLSNREKPRQYPRLQTYDLLSYTYLHCARHFFWQTNCRISHNFKKKKKKQAYIYYMKLHYITLHYITLHSVTFH